MGGKTWRPESSTGQICSIRFGKRKRDMVKQQQPVQNGDPKEKCPERRTWPRRVASKIPSLKSTGLFGDKEVRLINISRGGALVESEAIMRPGVTVCIRLVAADAVFLLRGRVTRSRISSLRGPVPSYESAISFTNDLSILVENADVLLRDPEPACAPPEGEPVTVEPGRGPASTADGQQPDAPTITASVPRSGPDLRQIFGLNNW